MRGPTRPSGHKKILNVWQSRFFLSPGDPKPKVPMTQKVFECSSYFCVPLLGSLFWVPYLGPFFGSLVWVPCLDRFLESFLYQLYGSPEILIRKYLISILVGFVILVRKAQLKNQHLMPIVLQTQPIYGG